MNILGILGSPHSKGNTPFAVKCVLETMDLDRFNTRFISLAGKNTHPCTGCMTCAAERKCIYDDDMGEILESLCWLYGLIIGSPVFWGMVSGQLKIMMDRCVLLHPSYEEPMEMTGKVGGGIACTGFRNGGQELTLQNIQTFLLQQNMQAFNDGTGYSHSGGAIAGEAHEDTLALKTVENLAHNLARVVKTQVV